MIRDVNTKIVTDTEDSVSGIHGLCDGKERSEMLIPFCRDENLVIKNTFY